jgi:hypothetical protein
VTLAAALTLVACGHDANVTGPQLQIPPQFQTFRIAGTVTAARGTLLEATILYDGLELPAARAVCDAPDGCTRLELEAGPIGATPGHHAIAFRVLRQTPSVVEYLVEGEVRGELGPADPIALGPTRASLEAGQSVTFEIRL